jgi:hypothetical protein
VRSQNPTLIGEADLFYHVKVIGIHPFTDTALLITDATRIVITPKPVLETHLFEGGADLTQQAESRRTLVPGLEKAYDALFDILSLPLLYPDLIRRLNIECPKGKARSRSI